MNSAFLKKYWWAILLGVLLVALGVWYYKRGQQTAIPDCKQKTPEDYLAALEYIESEIDRKTDWSNSVREQTSDLHHPCFNRSYEECRRINAHHWLTSAMGYCRQNI